MNKKKKNTWRARGRLNSFFHPYDFRSFVYFHACDLGRLIFNSSTNRRCTFSLNGVLSSYHYRIGSQIQIVRVGTFVPINFLQHHLEKRVGVVIYLLDM